jgi:hypothetical protein
VNKCVIQSTASLWFVVQSFLAHNTHLRRQMINVKQEDDGSLTITWDENDPKENILGTWTQEDFIHAIEDKLNSLKELGEVDNATEAINQVTDYFIDQTPEEVQQDIRNAQAFVRKDDEEYRTPRLFF